MATTEPSRSDPVAQLAALYILAEQQILAGGTRILGRTAATIQGQAEAYVLLRRLVQRIVAPLDAKTNALIHAMLTQAVASGRDTASRQVAVALREARASGSGSGGKLPPSRALDAADEPFDLSMGHGERAARAIERDLTSSLQDVRYRITRLPDDVYKAISPRGAIYQVHANQFTPAQAQAAAWRVFASQGVHGFTDRSGRDWSLSAYVEMAVRTAAMRAYNTSHLERMNALGVHYFTVPAHPGACPLCFPWQGALLCDNATNDENATTIAEATARGLFHPICEHTLIPVFPGITVLHPVGPWTAEHQALYDATQKQRRLELEVRKAKRREEYAYDPAAKASARTDVRAAQARVREFVNATPNLHRQSRREQIDLRDAQAKMPVPIR